MRLQPLRRSIPFSLALLPLLLASVPFISSAEDDNPKCISPDIINANDVVEATLPRLTGEPLDKKAELAKRKKLHAQLEAKAGRKARRRNVLSSFLGKRKGGDDNDDSSQGRIRRIAFREATQEELDTIFAPNRKGMPTIVGVVIGLEKGPTMITPGTTELIAPGATGMRFRFVGGCMGKIKSDTFYIYTPRGEVFTHTCDDFIKDELWSYSVMGDHAYVYFEQEGNDSLGSIIISGVAYQTNKMFGGSTQIPDAKDEDISVTGGIIGGPYCKNKANTSCLESAGSPTQPCGDANRNSSAIHAARLATGHIQWVGSSGFTHFCSGGLLNDLAESGAPLFLTSNHCLSNVTDEASLETFFQHWHDEEGCSLNCVDWHKARSNHPQALRILGASILSNSPSFGYSLLLLNGPAPPGSAFLGWNSSYIAEDEGHVLHRIFHPYSAPQAYATQTISPTKAWCHFWPKGPFMYSDQIFGGTIQGGTGGAIVINEIGQLVGQEIGICGFNVIDWCDHEKNVAVDSSFASSYHQIKKFLVNGRGNAPGGRGRSWAGVARNAAVDRTETCLDMPSMQAFFVQTPNYFPYLEGTVPECPTGSYVVVNHRFLWEDHRKNAQKANMKLMTIATETDRLCARALIEATGGMDVVGEMVWVGGTDSKPYGRIGEGNWVWDTNSGGLANGNTECEPLQNPIFSIGSEAQNGFVAPWNPGQPDNWELEEHFLALALYDGSYNFDDRPLWTYYTAIYEFCPDP